MTRLPDSIRADVVSAVTKCVQAAKTRDGFFEGSLIDAQESTLKKKIGMLAKKGAVVCVGGYSTDGAPGLYTVFRTHALWHLDRDPKVQEQRRTFEEASAAERQAERKKFDDRATSLSNLATEWAKLDPPDGGIECTELRAKAKGLRELSESLEESKIEQWLSENPPQSQAAAPELLAEGIVSDFEAWPRLYDHIISLPFPREIFQPVFDTRYVLSDGVRLELLSESDLTALHLDASYAGTYVLRVAIPGVKIDEGGPLTSSETETRRFLGLAIASGLIDVLRQGEERWSLERPKNVPLTIADLGPITASDFAASGFKAEVLSWTNDTRDFLPIDDSVVIAALVLPTEYGSPRLANEPKTWLLSEGCEVWRSNVHRLRRAVKEIAFVFEHDDLRLLSAGEWLFGSYVGDNEALQMVQAMTTLEILFGGTKDEQKEVGLTKLLANRLSYLLGTRQTKRDEIYETVTNLYDVRSKIVHSGLRKLEDESALDDARDLVKQAIRKELRFITALPE